LLHAKLQSSLLSIEFEHQCFHRLPNLQHILWMIDPLLRADVADVNHALYALGYLHEGAKFSEARDRTLDRSPDRKLLRSLNPRIPQRLLQSQRHALFTCTHSKDHSLNRFAGFHQIARLAYFLDPRHFGNVDQSFNSWL